MKHFSGWQYVEPLYDHEVWLSIPEVVAHLLVSVTTMYNAAEGDCDVYLTPDSVKHAASPRDVSLKRELQ